MFHPSPQYLPQNPQITTPPDQRLTPSLTGTQVIQTVFCVANFFPVKATVKEINQPGNCVMDNIKRVATLFMISLLGLLENN